MTNVHWETVVEGLGKLEAPCLDLDGNLCFSDIADDGAIFRLKQDGQVETVLRGRARVGGLVPHADGGFVASGDTMAIIREGVERVIMTANGGWGFNDFATDGAGNIYTGMHGERPQLATPPVAEASLWRIGVDGAITCCYSGIHLTNGVGISPEGTHLYHNDTRRSLVWVSDLSESGETTNRRVFFDLGDGRPDGMAIDEAGAVWVAPIGSGTVIRIAPNGRQDLVLDTPMLFTSALCFGGSDRRDLYVTTFGAEYDAEHSGSVIHTRADTPGFPVTAANV
jgi:sugar lactone lactonase YvrE